MMKSYWSWVGPKPKDCCPYKETQRHTRGERGRDRDDEADRQGGPRTAVHQQRHREVREDSPQNQSTSDFRLVSSRTMRK